MSHAILTIRGDVGGDSCYRRNIRRVNGKETGYSRSLRPISERFVNRLESVREESVVILN